MGKATLRIGLSGTGFIARGAAKAIAQFTDFELTGVLTRRPVVASAEFFPAGVLTNSIDRLVERSDIVIECSGDTIHAAEVMSAAGEAGRKIISITRRLR